MRGNYAAVTKMNGIFDFVFYLQMDTPALTDEQEEAIVRKWAIANLKGSRFTHLPADMLRVLIHYASMMSVEMHKDSQEYRAMKYLWDCVMTKQIHIECELCHKFGFDSPVLKYSNCEVPYITECMECDRNTCSHCIKNRCVNCDCDICKACADELRCAECNVVGCKPCRELSYVCEHAI
jgi:hypothetical protein